MEPKIVFRVYISRAVTVPGTDIAASLLNSLERSKDTMKWSILIITVWTFLAAPALCVEGVVTHVCVCDSVQECSHEADCSFDPCSEIALRSPSNAEYNPASTVLITLGPAMAPTPLSRTLLTHLTARPYDHNLPVLASDLPLLI